MEKNIIFQIYIVVINIFEIQLTLNINIHLFYKNLDYIFTSHNKYYFNKQKIQIMSFFIFN